MLYQLSYVRAGARIARPKTTFGRRGRGNHPLMLAVALAAVVLGIVFLFFLPWVGLPIGIVGLVLLGIWLLGVVRKSPEAAADEARSR
jgi:Flp pilus assembly protein TadB